MQKRAIIWIIVIFLVLATQDWSKSKNARNLNTAHKPTNNELVQSTQIPPPPASNIIRVVDGDTIVVRVGDVSEKIRLIGVNTPETVDPRRPVQCFGKEASAFTKSLLSGAVVNLETDKSQGDRDKYGRLLRYVFLDDGTFINKKIIEEGYGNEYTYRTPYKYQKDFKNAEQTARESKKGLWADGVCDAKNL